MSGLPRVWLTPEREREFLDAYDREIDRQRRTISKVRDMNRDNVYVEEMTTRNASIVVLHVDMNRFEGTARAHPDDLPGSRTIGRNLALSRAFKKAGRYYRKQAENELEFHAKNPDKREGRGFALPQNYDSSR